MDKNNDGKMFETDVRRLLHLQGWSISPEILINHKKTDGYATKQGDFGETKKIAIECKDYSNQLSLREVVNIYTDYSSLIEENQIDRVVLITRNGITPSARKFIQTKKNISHQTFSDLQNSIMDFSHYLHDLSALYENDEVSKYYVKQNYITSSIYSSDTDKIEQAILNWVNQDDENPLVILASYGMGKTSLVKRLCKIFVDKYYKNPNSRIPIFIPLGEIGSEQSLEGLLGKLFTSSHIVDHYNFNIFMQLNKSGRFVLFLDGFDEMKYAMSRDTLLYNFNQLNKLVEGSKVVLTGRPNAFLSYEEQLELLHGKRKTIGEKLRTIPDWPNYTELMIKPFSPEQIKEFFSNYIGNIKLSNKNKTIIQRAESSDFNSGQYNNLLSIASRPVQLKMLVAILPEWKENLDSVTITILFSEFIDLIIRRESDKITRNKFSYEKRRLFAQDFAWWMWMENMGLSVNGSQIPDSLFTPYLQAGDDLQSIKRDLLSACFIEVKPPTSYFFPHRSFQEYLVAEKLVHIVLNGFPIHENITNITPEVRIFFKQLINKAPKTSFGLKLWHYRGTLPYQILMLFLDEYSLPIEIENDKFAMKSPWSYLLLTLGIISKKWNINDAEIEFILDNFLALPPETNISSNDWVKLFILINSLLIPVLYKYKKNVQDRFNKLLTPNLNYNLFKNNSYSLKQTIEIVSTPDFCSISGPWLDELLIDGNEKIFYRKPNR